MIEALDLIDQVLSVQRDRAELRALFVSIVDALDLLAVEDETLSIGFRNTVRVVDESYKHLRERWAAEEQAQNVLLRSLMEAITKDLAR